MKLLFITRKYPPSLGGMQNFSWALSHEFAKKSDTTTISWGGSQIFLPFFLVYVLLKSSFIILYSGITHIHLGDALLSPLGLLLKTIFGIKCSVTVHGLDITYKPVVYQKIIPFCTSKLDKIICVSNATKEECIKRGINAKKCVVIPNGVYPKDFQANATKKDLENLVGISLENKKVIITVGRLVKRKGVQWFISNVIPDLLSPEPVEGIGNQSVTLERGDRVSVESHPYRITLSPPTRSGVQDNDYIYLVIGNGPQKDNIENLISKLKLDRQVILLDNVSVNGLKIILNTADVFIMPNIKVKGDMEGFGIVAIEASSAGLPVVASNIEGIPDAVINGENGLLVEEKNSNEFLKAITNGVKSLNKKSVKDFTTKNYSWPNITKEYLQIIK